MIGSIATTSPGLTSGPRRFTGTLNTGARGRYFSPFEQWAPVLKTPGPDLEQRAVVRDGEIATAQMLFVTLACDHRIAVDDARLGFPEVMLGLHPGLGGTVRLPRLINPLEAMTMMLTGRNVRAGRAKSLGLVDDLGDRPQRERSDRPDRDPESCRGRDRIHLCTRR